MSTNCHWLFENRIVQLSTRIEGWLGFGHGLSLKLDLNLGADQVLINQWRREYNHFRPHGSKNYRPPVPKTRLTIALT